MSNFVEIRTEPGQGGELLGHLPVSKEGGRLRNVIYMTASGTYSKPSWLKFVRVRGVGGGGGASGSKTTTSGQWSFGGPGNGAAYTEKVIFADDLAVSEVVTVGAGGTAGTGGSSPTSGGTGGTSSFGSHCSAPGGLGGEPSAAGSVVSAASVGEPVSGIGGDYNAPGEMAFRGLAPESRYSIHGGASEMGHGGGVSRAGGLYGGGAGGHASGPSAAAADGRAGGAGIVIIEEYE